MALHLSYTSIAVHYYTDPLGPVQEIAAVYPLNKEDPIVICWTPPPAYILAPVTRYHLKLTASTNEASTGDVTEVDVTADRRTCAAIDEYLVRGIIYGGVYALSIAAENTLGMSVYTSASVVVSLFKGQFLPKINAITALHVYVMCHLHTNSPLLMYVCYVSCTPAHRTTSYGKNLVTIGFYNCIAVLLMLLT